MAKEETTAKQEAPKTPNPVTGFAVFIAANGAVFIETNPAVLSVTVDRQSSLLEVRRACADIVSDLQAQTAAEYTIAKLKALEEAAKEEK